MAEIVDLERVISSISGFDVEREIKRSQTLNRTATVNRYQGEDVVAGGLGGADLEKGLSGRDWRDSAALGSSSISTLHDATNQLVPAEENDPNIVFWDGPDDPENPMVWHSVRLHF